MEKELSLVEIVERNKEYKEREKNKKESKTKKVDYVIEGEEDDEDDVESLLEYDEKEDENLYLNEESKGKIIKDYVPPTLNLVEPNPTVGGATAKFRNKLSKILTFIDCVKYCRSKDYCTILSLSCTSKTLHNIWGSDQNVSNAIKYMKEIGLLEVHDEYYQFNANNPDYNTCKSYKYYVEVEKKIVDYCNEHGIEKYIIKNEHPLKPNKKEELFKKVENNKVKPFERKDVVFNSKLETKLYKPNDVSCDAFERYLDECLAENYPAYRHYQRLADKINEKYYKGDGDLIIIFKPTFKWNKTTYNEEGEIITPKKTYVRGIGIRANNKLCSATKNDNNKDDKKRIKRSQVEKKYGIEFHEDVTSSVPRLTYGLNGGGWLDEKVDLYKEIYKKFDPLAVFEDELDNIELGKKESVLGHEFDIDVIGRTNEDGEPIHIVGKEERDAVKALFFRTYFDGSIGDLGHHTWRKMTHEGLNEDDVKETMTKLREAMESVIGNKRHNNEIFYAESCIYMDVLEILLSKGCFVWQVYDCFYERGFGKKEDFSKYVNEVIPICFMRYKLAGDFGCWNEILNDEDGKNSV